MNHLHPDETGSFSLAAPCDVRCLVGALRQAGTGGLTLTCRDAQLWRTTRTPDGPGTAAYSVEGTRLRIDAWGPGAGWLVAHGLAFIGESCPLDLREAHPLVRMLARRYPGFRVPRTEAVFETIVPAILEQKVTGSQAATGVAGVLRRWGESAPGPTRLLLPPLPEQLAQASYWEFHRHDIERRRAETVIRTARVASRLEEVVTMTHESAWERLTAVPGIGPWTAAEVSFRALGDPDAVSVGDYNIPHMICWGLAGEPRGSDARMLELLEPYRGWRAWVQRLMIFGGVRAPRFAPRMAERRIAAL